MKDSTWKIDGKLEVTMLDPKDRLQSLFHTFPCYVADSLVASCSAGVLLDTLWVYPVYHRL